MQSIEKAAEISEVRIDGVLTTDVFQELAQTPDLVADLGVLPAHGCRGLVPAQDAIQRRVELCLLSLLMWLDLFHEQPVHARNPGHRLSGGYGSERVRSLVELVYAGPDRLV